MEEYGPSLIKKLAACDQSIRDKALCSVLDSWLPSQTQVSEDVMKKLWQGIFYCIWHADKPAYQSQLIDRLSLALTTLQLPLSVHYFSVFFLTIRREWSRIDRLRLDKFYLLIRRFLGGFFLVLKNKSWDLELTQRLMGVLVDKTLLADDKFQVNGVNYHIASIFVEELREFLPLRKDVVELLFRPFFKVLELVSDKILVGKIKSNVFEELLSNGRKVIEAKRSRIPVEPEEDALGSIALSMGFSTRFFELGSSPDCFQGNRKSLFALHEEFLKLEKDMASSGIEIKISENVPHEDQDVPDLIPIACKTEVDDSMAKSDPNKKLLNDSSTKRLKKCSESKKASKRVKKGKKVSSQKEKKVEPTDGDDANKFPLVLDPSHANDTQNGDENNSTLDETIVMNLRVQFEKAASELGWVDDITSIGEVPVATSNGKASKKRKKAMKAEDGESQCLPEVPCDAENGTTSKSHDKSAKRVRFSMNNNLVWKPNNPLPPQSLRIPPSARPRGSALKKGIPPGPIREMPSPMQKAKSKSKSVKKARKGLKAIRRLKKKKGGPSK